MKLNNKYIVVACDGGAATGKSTGAKMISKKYKLKFLSSGLLYRYAGYVFLKYKPNIDHSSFSFNLRVLFISFSNSLEAVCNPFNVLPIVFPSWGKRFGPKINNASTTITAISGIPIPKMFIKNLVFYYFKNFFFCLR